MTLTELLAPIGWVACIHLAAFSTGDPVRRRLLRDGKRLEHGAWDALFSTILGFVLLANLVLLLGALRLLHPWLLVGLVLLLAAHGAFRLARRVRRPRIRLSLQDLPLALAVAVTLAFLPSAVLPWLEHDDIVYHVLLPRLYLEQHAIVALPWNLYANVPHMIEVLYVLPFAGAGFVAVKVLAYSLTFWTLAGFVAFGSTFMGRAAAGILGLLYVSGRNIQWIQGSAHVESVIGLFLLCAVLAILAWIETRNRGYLWILGLFCGAACASKYTAWYFAAVILAVAAVAILRSEGPLRAHGRSTAAVAGICLCLVLPWLVKNAMVTGNPLYPNFYRLLDGAHWSEIQDAQFWNVTAIAGSPVKDWKSTVRLPYDLVLGPVLLFQARPFSAALMIFLLAAPFLRSTYRYPYGLLLALGAGGFLVWAATFQQGRYLVAWVPVLVLSASATLVPLLRRSWSTAAATLLVVGLGVAQRLGPPKPNWDSLDIFTKSEQELLERNLLWGTCEILNRELPPTAKVVGLWENRFYFLDRPFICDGLYEAPSVLARLRELDDVDAFAGELASQGYTHALIHRRNFARFANNRYRRNLLDERVYPEARWRRDLALFGEFARRHLERVKDLDELTLFRIRAPRDG